MAFTNNLDWAGQPNFLFDFFSAALYNNGIFARMSPMLGVKNYAPVPKVSISGLLQTDACAYTDQGDITLDPRILTVCHMKINKTICIQDVEPKFLSLRLRQGANSEVGPEEFISYLLSLIQETLSNSLQNIMWNGIAGSTTTETGLCDGFIYLFGTAGSGVVGITAASIGQSTANGGATAGNVQGILGAVFSNIPAQVKSQGQNVVFLASQNVVDAYKLSQVNTSGGLLPVGDKALNFLGYEIIPTPYMPTSNVVAADLSNLWYGTDADTDRQELKILDQRNTAGDDSIRIKGRLAFGVQFGVGSEIVWYKP